ncbi:MAG: M56 family metallopeptidase [Clostridium sp.]|nr:M56 family metallopeptidase [Clostridium sp.]
MASITIYAVSVGIVFALCTLAYRLCLSGATFHRFNRTVILSLYAISLAAPAIVTILARPDYMAAAGMPIAVGFGGAGAEAAPAVEHVNLWQYVPVAYAIGASLTLAFTAIGLFRIISIIRKGERRKIDGATLVIVDEDVAPFSWWKWIVVSRQDACNAVILRHELCHVRGMHTADLALAQMFAIFNWFNPLAWAMRSELSAQHEYAVDAAMLRGGVDAREYQMLIVRKAVGLNMGPLANCLHSSQLKKRVKMMLKMKTKSIRGLMAAAIAPAVIAAMALIQTPAVASSLSQMREAPKASEKTDTLYSAIDEVRVIGYGAVKKTDENKVVRDLSGTEIVIDGQKATEEELKALNPDEIADITVFRDPDQIIVNTKKNASAVVEDGEGVELPKFKAGEAEMFKRLSEMVRYPEEAVKEQAQGVAAVGFVVNPDGKAGSFEIKKSAGNPSLDAEAVRACQEALSEEWIPGKKDGKEAAVYFVVPVSFKLK